MILLTYFITGRLLYYHVIKTIKSLYYYYYYAWPVSESCFCDWLFQRIGNLFQVPAEAKESETSEVKEKHKEETKEAKKEIKEEKKEELKKDEEKVEKKEVLKDAKKGSVKGDE